LLYDPATPDEAVFLDSFGSKPQLDETGAFRPNGMRAALLLVFPALVVGGNLYWAWSRFTH
jgi:hypothetical protein